MVLLFCRPYDPDLMSYLSCFVDLWILFCRYRDPELPTIVRLVAARPGDPPLLGAGRRVADAAYRLSGER
jgi:hypothetical protein